MVPWKIILDGPMEEKIKFAEELCNKYNDFSKSNKNFSENIECSTHNDDS